MKEILIDPITRLEGHGKIDIFVDDDDVRYLDGLDTEVADGIDKSKKDS